MGLHGLDENRQVGVEWCRVPHGLGEFREHLLLEKLTSLLKWLASHVLPGEHQHIEHVVHDWRGCGAVILQRVERWTTLFIESDDLAIDHRVVRQLAERLHDRGICCAEIVVVSRPQADVAFPLERDGAIPVELQLV